MCSTCTIKVIGESSHQSSLEIKWHPVNRRYLS